MATFVPADEMRNIAVPGRYLRHRKDGTIYGWTPMLAENPNVMEVTEQEAFPERFIPEEQQGRKSGLDLSTADDVVAEATGEAATPPAAKGRAKSKGRAKKTKSELAADASKGLK